MSVGGGVGNYHLSSPILVPKDLTREATEPVEYSGKGQTKVHGFSTNKQEIGQGGTGTIYLSRDDQRVVIKKSDGKLSSHFKPSDYIKEYLIGMSLDHKCLMKVYALGIKTKENGDKTYKIKMERVDGKTIYDMTHVTLDSYKKILQDAFDCLVYLYSQNITWKDLDSGCNAMINGDQIKFIDFGRYEKIENKNELLKCLFSQYSMVNGQLSYKLSDSDFGKIVNKLHMAMEPARSNLPSTEHQEIFAHIRQAIDNLPSQ